MVDLIKINDLEIAPNAEGSDYVLIVQNGIARVVRAQDLPFIEGPKGPKGDTGAALSVKGKLNDPSDLPTDGQPGDAYFIGTDIWVWVEDESQWLNVGQVKGEKGDKGDTGNTGEPMRIIGSLDNVSQLPTTGNVGNAYIIGTDLYFWNDLTTQWVNVGRIKGEEGDKGDKGDIGQPLIISGVLASVADLPINGNIGESWMVVDHLYQYSDGAWHDLGVMRGPAGTGVPTGGKTYQVNIKTADDDYQMGWTYLHDIPTVKTIADAELATFSDAITSLFLQGVNQAGDTGGYLMTFVRVETLDFSKLFFASTDGKLWELRNNIVTLEMYGGNGDGVFDNREALISAIASTSIIELLPNKTYKLNSPITVSRRFTLIGNGSNIDITNSNVAITVAGSNQPAQTVVTTDIAAGSNVGIASGGLPSSWAIGTIVRFLSSAVVAGTTTAYTEYNTVSAIDSATNTATFYKKLRYGYLTSSSARMVAPNMIDGIVIKDVNIIGATSAQSLIFTNTINLFLENIFFKGNIAPLCIYESINPILKNVRFDTHTDCIRLREVESITIDGVVSRLTSSTIRVLSGAMSRNIRVYNITATETYGEVIQTTEAAEDFYVDGVNIMRQHNLTHRDMNFTNPNVVVLNNVNIWGTGGSISIAATITNNTSPNITATNIKSESPITFQIPTGAAAARNGIQSLKLKNITGAVSIASGHANTRHKNIEIDGVILTTNNTFAVSSMRTDTLVVRNVSANTTANSIVISDSTGIMVMGNSTDSINANSWGLQASNCSIGIVSQNIFRQDKDYKTALTTAPNVNIIVSYDNYFGANNTKRIDQTFLTTAVATSDYLTKIDASNTYLQKASTGNVVSRNVTVSTSDPSGGVDGDIWLKV